jgi:uncharacterized protein
MMNGLPHLALFYDGEKPIAYLRVKLAITKEELAEGLSTYTSLDNDAGMAFLFEEPTPRVVKMQMRETQLPLDMLFVDADAKVVAIETADAMSADLYGPEIPVLFVIEANAGWADQNGVGVGSLVAFA